MKKRTIKCPYCFKKYKVVSNSHLKKHNKTIEQAKKEFPNVSFLPAYCNKKGKKFKESTKKLISLSKKGKTWEEIYGKEKAQELRRKLIVRSIGRKFSDESRMKNSLSHQKELNPNWQGGKSSEHRSREFNKLLKDKIRKRDNYACQECNYTEFQLGYKLSVHHIDYNKKNCDSDNLISLCRSCHIKTNFGRSNWTDYYKSKVTKII